MRPNTLLHCDHEMDEMLSSKHRRRGWRTGGQMYQSLCQILRALTPLRKKVCSSGCHVKNRTPSNYLLQIHDHYNRLSPTLFWTIVTSTFPHQKRRAPVASPCRT